MYHNYGNDLIDGLIGYNNSTNTVEEIVALVKANSSLLNKLDASNRTPLFHLLNECKTDYKEYDRSSVKPNSILHKALILLQHGANPNIQDKYGWTVLHECASIGHLPMMQLCIRHGAEVGVANREGKLPIDVAILKNHTPIVEYLEIQSCDLKNMCRRSIRQAMGKRTYGRINELPLPTKLKLFVNFYNPYPGFSATIFVPRPWPEEDILNGSVKKTEIKEFFEETASSEFNAEKGTDKITSSTSVDELAAMMETLYFWESFKSVNYEEQPARPPRYNMGDRHPANNYGFDDDGGRNCRLH